MEKHEIKTYADLPPYGKYVLVKGVDKLAYDTEQFHVCCIDDLEDGLDFEEGREWYWLTEAGTKIENVNYWWDLPHKRRDKERK